MTISASNNAAVATDGTLTFGGSEVTGTVVLTLTNATDPSDTADTAAISVTVPAGRIATTDDASDLLFSQYIEGSSNNKAFEIANNTGADVDLSNYCVYQFYNDDATAYDYSTIAAFDPAANPQSVYRFSGTVLNGDVFVVGNDSADSGVIPTESDLILGYNSGNYGRYVTGFNGDDSLALYKTADDGVTWQLVDLIGGLDVVAGDSFGDKTLIRKADTGPNTVYTAAEWYEFSQNTFTDLGSHVY